MPKRTYGSGRIYRQKGRKVWTLRYFVDGQRIVESARTTDRSEAQTILDKKIEAKRKQRPTGAKVSFEALAEVIVSDYQRNGRKTLGDAKRRISHLARTFKGKLAHQINGKSIDAFVTRRLEEGASNAEINRELAVLNRMFTLAKNREMIDWAPAISTHRLAEPPPRSGFFEPDELRAVLARLPEHLRSLATFLYTTGWRVSEALSLQWSQVDLVEGSIRLEAGTTKNRDGRKLHLSRSLLALIRERWEDHLDGWQHCPYVFHLAGQQIRDPRHAWRKACVEAGFGMSEVKVTTGKRGRERRRIVYHATKLLHDFRRTGVRNLVRADVPESVVMDLVGHRTRSILDRYNITGDRDRREAAEKLDRYHRELDERAAARMGNATYNAPRPTGDQSDLKH